MSFEGNNDSVTPSRSCLSLEMGGLSVSCGVSEGAAATEQGSMLVRERALSVSVVGSVAVEPVHRTNDSVSLGQLHQYRESTY